MIEWLSDIELWATVFGVICVALTIKQNIWCWPAGLVMVSLYIVVFYDARLYSDMLLQVVYIFMQLYGWHYWLGGGREDAPAQVARLSSRGWAVALSVAAVGTIGLGTFMDTQTDADLPYWDALTTVLSLVAQWLMAKKVLASWLFWIVVDVIAVGVYWVKELYPTTALYAVFLLMAIAGLVAWSISYKAQLQDG